MGFLALLYKVHSLLGDVFIFFHLSTHSADSYGHSLEALWASDSCLTDKYHMISPFWRIKAYMGKREK